MLPGTCLPRSAFPDVPWLASARFTAPGGDGDGGQGDGEEAAGGGGGGEDDDAVDELTAALERLKGGFGTHVNPREHLEGGTCASVWVAAAFKRRKDGWVGHMCCSARVGSGLQHARGTRGVPVTVHEPH